MDLPSAFRPPSNLAERRYVDHLHRCDPPADALAAELEAGGVTHAQVQAALSGARPATATLAAFVQALAPPLWVDPVRSRRGCEALQRTNLLGGLVLALYSLPLGYLSRAAVKPLTFSGRFVDQAPRRLSETNRFLVEVTTPGGMEVGKPGWRITALVRLMHAVVRRRIRPGWRSGRWGKPINQAHMAGTNLLFSLHALDGLQKLGVRFDRDDVEAYLHLWRHVGYTIGVVDELLCATEADARQFWAALEAVERPPDTDGQQLAQALLGQAVPEALSALLPFDVTDPRLVQLIFRLSTALLGREQVAMLGFPAQPGPLVVAPLLRTLVGGIEAVRTNSPRSHAWLLSLGMRVNHQLADAALHGQPARFVA